MPTMSQSWIFISGDGVLFAERANEFFLPISLSAYGTEAQGNQVLKGRKIKLVGKDPKPDELVMTRMKLLEIRVEVRTRLSFNALG